MSEHPTFPVEFLVPDEQNWRFSGLGPSLRTFFHPKMTVLGSKNLVNCTIWPGFCLLLHQTPSWINSYDNGSKISLMTIMGSQKQSFLDEKTFLGTVLTPKNVNFAHLLPGIRLEKWGVPTCTRKKLVDVSRRLVRNVRNVIVSFLASWDPKNGLNEPKLVSDRSSGT